MADTYQSIARFSTNGEEKKRINLKKFGEEVEGGLSNLRNDLDEAQERQDFFNYEGERWESRFRRDAESSFDYQGRPHRPSGFMRECIEVLTEHLYCPGPSRAWEDATGNDFLQRVWSDNVVDALLQECDVLSTLNQTAAIQIDAGEGDYEKKPITYRVWGKEQFVVWEDPDNATCPLVVCTIDKYDQRKRYRLWSDTEVWTYITKRGDETTGGTAATRVSTERHEYGCLPFSFVHYRLPIRTFDVSCIGELLHRAEVRIDNRLYSLDESCQKHVNPIPIAEGVPPDWKPVLEAQRFIRLPRAAPSIGSSGGYEPGEFARLYYLEAHVDIAGQWEDLLNYINQVLHAAHVPLRAVSLDQEGVMSGIALILEQAPLLQRAKARQRSFSVYECDLARRTLWCAGYHYGKPELVTSADMGILTLSWPRPTMAIPTPDVLDLLVAEVQAGFKSHLMGIQQWYGVTRDESIKIVKQIKEDTEELASLYPELSSHAEPVVKTQENKELQQQQLEQNGDQPDVADKGS